MARSNKSKYAILGYLSKKPLSGYGLKKFLDKISGFYWSESNAQIYPILKKLSEEELISGKETHVGDRNSVVYKPTAKGLSVLKAWLKEPACFPIARNEPLLKIALGEHIDTSDMITHVEDYQIQLKQKMKRLEIIEGHIREDHKDRADHDYLVLTYQHCRLTLEAELTWCTQTLNTLRKRELTSDKCA